MNNAINMSRFVDGAGRAPSNAISAARRSSSARRRRHRRSAHFGASSWARRSSSSPGIIALAHQQQTERIAASALSSRRHCLSEFRPLPVCAASGRDRRGSPGPGRNLDRYAVPCGIRLPRYLPSATNSPRLREPPAGPRRPSRRRRAPPAALTIAVCSSGDSDSMSVPLMPAPPDTNRADRITGGARTLG